MPDAVAFDNKKKNDAFYVTFEIYTSNKYYNKKIHNYKRLYQTYCTIIYVAIFVVSRTSVVENRTLDFDFI